MPKLVNNPDFWANVEVRGAEECWPWRGGKMGPGYGAFFGEYAHRKALEIHLGRELAPGMDSCHTCDNRICANGTHLFEGTRKQNIADCIAKRRFKFLPSQPGESHPQAKLTEADVLAIRAEPGTHREIAARRGLDHSTVGLIKRRKLWRHLDG